MKNLILILFAFSQMNCASYNTSINSRGKIATGVFIDEESKQPIIGQSVYEYERHSNNTLTDTSGKFQIEFIGNKPVIELTGTYKPIIVEIEFHRENIITLNNQTSQQSKILLKQLNQANKKTKKKWAEFPIDGIWEVIEVNYHYSQQYDYMDEIDPTQRPNKLKRQFPNELKLSEELHIKQDRIIVNNSNQYRFSKGSENMYISVSDVVYTYEVEIEDANQIRFRKETTVGETEWTIKRK